MALMTIFCILDDGDQYQYRSEDEQLANAKFIANAPTDIARLLAEVERQRAEVARLKDEVASLEQELKFSDETEYDLIKKLFDLKICHKEWICEQDGSSELNFEGENGCHFCWRQWAIMKARKEVDEEEAISDRSEQTLRERLDLAKKATPKGERTLWTVDHAGRGDLCIRDAFNERMLTMEDSTDMATAQHIAANHPDVVRTDLEEILALRAEVERLRAETEALKNSAFEFGVVFSTKVNEMLAREDWLITHILEKDTFRCPMPEAHECEQRYGLLCCLDSSETESRRQCWRKAADMATRENPGESEVAPESEQGE